MMRLSFVAAVACTPGPRSGTAVGNPGDLDAEARVTDPDLELDQAQIPIAHVFLQACNGEVDTVQVDAILDGLGPSERPAPLIGGDWCGVEIDPGGPIRAIGLTAAGTGFDVEIPLGPVELVGRFQIDGHSLIFALDLPLAAADLDALGTDVVVLQDDEAAIDWGEALRQATSLWEDTDADGRVADPDRFVAGTGPVAASDVVAASEAGCGCAATSPGPSAWVLGLVGWAARRRRHT